jgi:hypothetical protein
MFQDLQLECVAIFTVSIPMLVLVRYRYPEFPAWHFIVLAAVLGWVLANAHAGVQHLWVDAEHREELAAFDEAVRHPQPPVKQPDGSWVISGAGIADFLWEEYQPVTAIFYGPAYLVGCFLASWAILHQTA